MTDQEARSVFNQAIAGATDPERIATIELLREYFCNPDFRAYLEYTVYNVNSINDIIPIGA